MFVGILMVFAGIYAGICWYLLVFDGIWMICGYLMVFAGIELVFVGILMVFAGICWYLMVFDGIYWCLLVFNWYMLVF